MKEIKLNAVKALMQSLEFNREDKEALLHILQQELGMSDKRGQQSADTSALSQEYGSPLPMEVLFNDGTIGWRQDKGKKILGVVIRSAGRKFALYASHPVCPDNASLSDAIAYTSGMPKVKSRAWRVLTIKDCYAIKDQFHKVNQTLSMIGSRTIVESNSYGVLASDDNMRGARGWQVWFAMDL